MNTIETIKERYRQLQSNNGQSVLTPIEQNAFKTFNTLGIPTVKHEEWKYTRISSVFNKEYAFNPEDLSYSIGQIDLDSIRFPGYEEANELVFINGLYSSQLSTIRSENLTVISLQKPMQHLVHLRAL